MIIIEALLDQIDAQFVEQYGRQADWQAVKAVASQVGYGNATAFARAFQRASGQSPSAWQMEHLSQP